MQKIIYPFLLSIVVADAKAVKKTSVPPKECVKRFEPYVAKPADKPLEKTVTSQEPLTSNTHFVIGLGAGGLQQNDHLKADEDAGNSFSHVNHPYAVNCGVGSLNFGIQTYQGITYLGAFLYGYLSPLNKEVYRSAADADTLDYISVRTTGAVGALMRFGLNLPKITAYGLIGIQWGPRSITYVCEDPVLPARQTFSNKQPTYVFGVGLMGDIAQNWSLGLEVQRQVSQDFSVKLPRSAALLNGDFLRVKTARWMVQAIVSYKFNLG